MALQQKAVSLSGTRNRLTGAHRLFGILLPAGILLFLEQSSGFSGFALGTLVLFLCYAVVFVSHTLLQSRNAWQYTEFRTGFLRAAFSVISCR